MATIAIGDLHGNLEALDDLLGKIEPILQPEDILVFLGDYVDRGPDSKGCVDRVLQLELEVDCDVVALLGNHEDWLLKARNDPTSHSWLLGMEIGTVASYSAEAAHTLRHAAEKAGMALVTDKVGLPYHEFFDLLPAEHLSFLTRLRLYHRTPDVLCVHAGTDLEGGALDQQGRDVFIWGPDGFPEKYRGSEAVVYGHWNDCVEDDNGWPQPYIRENKTYGIDSIAKGVLTAMRFPDKKVFQSKRYSPQ